MSLVQTADFTPSAQKYAQPGGRDTQFHPGWWILPGVLLVLPFWVAAFRGATALIFALLP